MVLGKSSRSPQDVYSLDNLEMISGLSVIIYVASGNMYPLG